MEENAEKKSNFHKSIFVVSFIFFLCILVFTFRFDLYLKEKVKKQKTDQTSVLRALLAEKDHKKSVIKELESKTFLKTSTIDDDSIENHIPYEGKFIGADLDHMKLYLYENGDLIEEYPILSKGKPGSFWETPSGNYQVLDKIPNHFSSIGGVYMPHSMQFYGNFFIHGWPYYPGGTPVSPGYSGGCIRLETEDAKHVYAFSEKGTPLFVHESSKKTTFQNKNPVLKNIPVPNVSALAFIVADVNTGEVFSEKNSGTVLPIASLTKLMTAIVSNEAVMFDRKITISDEMLQTYGDSGNLRKGEIITANDILFPLLMESSNDAAKALALYYGEKSFTSLMNKKALAIGMYSTTFADSSGISDENSSTVYDLYLLAKYLKNKKSFILNVSKLPTKNIATSLHEHTFHNFNIFSAEKNFLGGKTGYTRGARETMLSLFEIPIHDEIHNIAIIVLHSDNREKDVRSLLRWFKDTAS